MDTWQDSGGRREAGRVQGSFQQFCEPWSPVRAGGKEVESNREAEGCEERTLDSDLAVN